jgi:peptidoglycan/LPS O-acetylase OafA/YrhL
VRSTHLPSLDSLRGVAILSVIAFHFFGILSGGKLGAGADAQPWTQLAAAGNTGVTLFFVLSAFLLARPFLEELRAGRASDLRRYFRARVLRIVPLYWIAVLLAWGVIGHPSTPKALLFLRINFAAFPFSVPWWTLTLEVQFYLLLPLAMWSLRTRLGRWALALILIAWMIVQIQWVHRPDWQSWTNEWQNSFVDRGFAFVAGCLAAAFHLSSAFERFSRSRVKVLACAILATLALVALLRFAGERGELVARTQMPLYHDVEAALWALLCVCAVALKSHWWVLDHFGRISYSLYLSHVPVTYYVMRRLTASTAVSIAASLMATWLLSLVTYRFIEQPFLRLKTQPAHTNSPVCPSVG